MKLEQPLLEQRVPTWDRPRLRTASADGASQDGDGIERAVLDIEYTQDAVRKWIDVTVRHPAAFTGSSLARAARRMENLRGMPKSKSIGVILVAHL